MHFLKNLPIFSRNFHGFRFLSEVMSQNVLKTLCKANGIHFSLFLIYSPENILSGAMSVKYGLKVSKVPVSTFFSIRIQKKDCSVSRKFSENTEKKNSRANVTNTQNFSLEKQKKSLKREKKRFRFIWD